MEECNHTFGRAVFWKERLEKSRDELREVYAKDPQERRLVFEPYRSQVSKEIAMVKGSMTECLEFRSMSADEIIIASCPAEYPSEEHCERVLEGYCGKGYLEFQDNDPLYSSSAPIHYVGHTTLKGEEVIPWMSGKLRYEDRSVAASGRTFKVLLENFRGTNSIQDGGIYQIRVAEDRTWDQKGWYLSVHHYYTQDRRDKDSVYAHVHRHESPGAQWILQRERDDLFRIKLIGAEGEHFMNEGGALAVHRCFEGDSRDENSNYAMVHNDTSKECTKWKIERKHGDMYAITMGDDGYGNEGWSLTPHRYYSGDNRDRNSTYLAIHKNSTYLWHLELAS